MPFSNDANQAGAHSQLLLILRRKVSDTQGTAPQRIRRLLRMHVVGRALV